MQVGTQRDQDHIKLLDILQCLAAEIASICSNELCEAMCTPLDLPRPITVSLMALSDTNAEITNGLIQNPSTYLPLLDESLLIAQDILFHENPV
jgi:hypothetical protein